MDHRHSITKATLASWIATILLISVVLTVFFIYQKYSDFEERFESEYNQYQKKHLENEVNNVIKYISSEKLLAEKNINNGLASIVKETASGSLNDKQSNIQKRVLEKLSSIKFGRSKTGNTFVLNQSGDTLMCPSDMSSISKNGTGNTELRKQIGKIVESAKSYRKFGFSYLRMKNP